MRESLAEQLSLLIVEGGRGFARGLFHSFPKIIRLFFDLPDLFLRLGK